MQAELHSQEANRIGGGDFARGTLGRVTAKHEDSHSNMSKPLALNPKP